MAPGANALHMKTAHPPYGFRNADMSARARDVEIYWSISRDSRKDESRSRAIFDARKAQFSSDHVRRCARQLLRNLRLREALDPLLDVPGLRSGMRISTAHKLISLKCDEVRESEGQHRMSDCDCQ